MKTLRAGVAVLVSLGALLGGARFLTPDLCANTVVAEYPSPGRVHKVVVFQRDCGATTGFSTQASIVEIGKSLGHSSGNVFTSDSNHGAAPEGAASGPALRVHWIDSATVVLSYHPMVRVFEAQTHFDGVSLQYVTDPSVTPMNDPTVPSLTSPNVG